LQTALKTEKLDEVNKVLGKMKVAEAENIVELMQEGGMLSFRFVHPFCAVYTLTL